MSREVEETSKEKENGGRWRGDNCWRSSVIIRRGRNFALVEVIRAAVVIFWKLTTHRHLDSIALRETQRIMRETKNAAIVIVYHSDILKN